HVRQARGILRGARDLLLLHAELLALLIRNERIGDVAEGLLDGLLIEKRSFLLPRLGETDAAADAAAFKHRLCDAPAEIPQSRRTAEKTGQSRALITARTRQRDTGEIIRLRDADLRVQRDQLLLGLSDIGPALEQYRWKTSRDLGSVGLLQQCESAWYVAGILSQQSA